jgi:hypothetical protein
MTWMSVEEKGVAGTLPEHVYEGLPGDPGDVLAVPAEGGLAEHALRVVVQLADLPGMLPQQHWGARSPGFGRAVTPAVVLFRVTIQAVLRVELP